MERPLLFPLVALMTGIGATTYLGFQFSHWLILPALLAVILSFISCRRQFLILAVSLLSLLWGGISTAPYTAPSFPPDHIVRKLSESPVAITGVVYKRPQKKGLTTRLFIATESMNGTPATGKIMLTVKGEAPSLMTGDRLGFEAKLREPRNFGVPGEFEFRRSLTMQGIFVTGYLGDKEKIACLERGAAYGFQRRIDEIADWLGRFIERSLPSPESGILKALLVGDRGTVPAEIEELYARTGVNHILSISGFHLGIVAFVTFQLLLAAARLSPRLLHYNIRWLLLLATLPLLAAYLLVSGAAPATLRSLLMISACFLALFLERETEPVNVLALAAFVILVFSPGALFDISFQLSFIALWGILVITPLLLDCYRWEQKGWPFRLFQFAAVSFAAISATLLPVAYSFHRVSLVGMLSNFVVVPLLGYGAVVIGFTSLVLAPLSPTVALPLLKLASLLVSWSDRAMIWIDRIPQLPAFTPSLLELTIALAFLLVLTMFRASGNRVIASALLVSIFIVTRIVDLDIDDNRFKLLFLSVGHGDCTFIRFPDGSNMLVDGGGALQKDAFDAGDRVVVPALRTIGVHRIDRLVLSHPHPDHVRGLVSVARNFPVGEFWESGYNSSFPPYLELKKLLEFRKVPVRVINGTTPSFTAGGALIEPLAPAASRKGGGIDPADWEANEESLVIRLSVGSFSLLLTGDSGFVSESRLLQRPQSIASTVLKVAHHGSRFSSSVPFLQAVSPRLSVISAGYGNSFHLPAPETVADIRKVGSEIHRTDLDGSLEMSVNPSTGGIETRKYPPLRIDRH